MTDPSRTRRAVWTVRKPRAAAREVALTLRRGLAPVMAILVGWTIVAVGQTPTGLRSAGEVLGAASTVGVASVLAAVLAYTWVAGRSAMPAAWNRLQQGGSLPTWIGEWLALLVGAAAIHMAAALCVITVYRIMIPDSGPMPALAGLATADLAALSPVFAAASILSRLRLPGWLSATTWGLLTALALRILPGVWPVPTDDPAPSPERAIAAGVVATVAVWCASLGVGTLARGAARP